MQPSVDIKFTSALDFPHHFVLINSNCWLVLTTAALRRRATTTTTTMTFSLRTSWVGKRWVQQLYRCAFDDEQEWRRQDECQPRKMQEHTIFSIKWMPRKPSCMQNAIAPSFAFISPYRHTHTHTNICRTSALLNLDWFRLQRTAKKRKIQTQNYTCTLKCVCIAETRRQRLFNEYHIVHYVPFSIFLLVPLHLLLRHFLLKPLSHLHNLLIHFHNV